MEMFPTGGLQVKHIMRRSDGGGDGEDAGEGDGEDAGGPALT